MLPTEQTRLFAGLTFRTETPRGAAQVLIERKTDQTDGLAVHLANAYTVALTMQDREYGALFRNAECIFADGKPISWLSQIAGPPLHQVRGPSLFRQVIDDGRDAGLRHFLLGASESTLSRLKANILREYPGVEIVGSWNPPFRELTAAEREWQDDQILCSGADVVWVGLGTPKQDFEVERLASQLPVVAVAIGAAFDFVAGTKREAPAWMTRSGTEWIFRLATEPRRLWRRYLVGNLLFLYAAAAHPNWKTRA